MRRFLTRIGVRRKRVDLDVPRLLAESAIMARRMLNRLGLRDHKVFVIGFNKCASTSIHLQFEAIGLPACHGPHWRSHDDEALLREFDCFSDGEPRDLPALLERFPTARYILNVRDLRGWVYSRLGHIERMQAQEDDYTTGPTWAVSEEAVSSWILLRNRYHKSVLNLFKDRPRQLLTVNYIADPRAAARISHFLGTQRARRKARSNVNPATSIPHHHQRLLTTCLEGLGVPISEADYDLYCPSLEDGTPCPVPCQPDTDLIAG